MHIYVMVNEGAEAVNVEVSIAYFHLLFHMDAKIM